MKRRAVGAEEARASLPALLEDAHRGKATIITRRGVPYAVLVPVEQARERKRLPFLSLKGTGAGLWGKRAGAAVAKMRDEWE